jgi:hypothetical protein
MAIISMASFFISQFEYELLYNDVFYCVKGVGSCYANCPKDNYQGKPVRIIVSSLCVFLAFLTIYTSYLSYSMKKEQKKIINSI